MRAGPPSSTTPRPTRSTSSGGGTPLEPASSPVWGPTLPPKREKDQLINVRIARAFEGPRHTRLERIWDCVAEFKKATLRLKVHPNPGARKTHAQMFAEMWAAEQKEPNRWVLLTEFDFLPDLWSEVTPTAPILKHEVDAMGVYYCTRNPSSKQLVFPDNTMAGGWWLLIDKERAPKHLDFEGQVDPCTSLLYQMDMLLLRGQDCYPHHYGVSYPYGVHLFWSRHYHDDPNTRVAGVLLGEVQRKHDVAVTDWLHAQPKRFIRLVEKRCGKEFANALSPC